jgi:predicted metal-dependent peptidase
VDRKKHVSNLITSLIVDYPVYGLLLKRCKIVYRDKDFVAAVNRKEILVGKRFFEYPIHEQKAILAHEAVHLLSRHPERSKALVKKYGVKAHEVANIVADGKINSALEADGIPIPKDGIRVPKVCEMFDLSEDYVVKESMEQIVIDIMKKTPEIEIEIPLPDIEPDEGEESQEEGESEEQRDTENGEEQQSDAECGEEQQNEEEVLNEGDRRIAEAKDEEELAQAKTQILLEIEASARKAGIGATGLSRIVQEIAKPKVNWRRVLRVVMERGIGSDVRKTWSRSSKKHKDLPAKYTCGVKKVLALVDTSGSITQDDLRQILGELYAIAKMKAQVTVIPWDWEVYEEVVMKSPKDIEKVMKHLKGGGGTKITPAIERAKELSKNGEFVVIFSDFYLTENDQELDGLIKGFSDVLLVSVNGRVPEVKAKVVKIETVR